MVAKMKPCKDDYVKLVDIAARYDRSPHYIAGICNKLNIDIGYQNIKDRSHRQVGRPHRTLTKREAALINKFISQQSIPRYAPAKCPNCKQRYEIRLKAHEKRPEGLVWKYCNRCALSVSSICSTYEYTT